MPRTKGTATLHACKREQLYNEPIGWYSLFPELVPDSHYVGPSTLLDVKQRIIDFPHWESLRDKLDHPNAASKIFGGHIKGFPKTRSWLHDANKHMTHDIFILLRNPREILLSLLLAFRFGFTKVDEIGDQEIEIDDNAVLLTDNFFQDFLTYYPSNGKIITFDSLPVGHFDYKKIDMEPQHSLTRRSPYVKNLDEVKKKIDIILNFHRIEWEEKTGTDIFV